MPTTVDAIRFASKKESRRYLDLKLMEKAGLIRDLECHPKFPIHIVPQSCWGNGAVVPVRVATYIADFSYRCRAPLKRDRADRSPRSE